MSKSKIKYSYMYSATKLDTSIEGFILSKKALEAKYLAIDYILKHVMFNSVNLKK